MVYEKKKITAAAGGSSTGADVCHFCDREKSAVICESCGHIMNYMRARRRCEIHPRVFFYQDAHVCGKCKGTQLLEFGLDDIPERLLTFLKPTGQSAIDMTGAGSSSPQRRGSSATPPLRREGSESPTPMAIDVPLSPPPVQRNQNAMVVRAIAVPFGGAQPPRRPPSPPPNFEADCICRRQVTHTMCCQCGFLSAEGVRKFIPCQLHPQERRGLKFCPECGSSGDILEEY